MCTFGNLQFTQLAFQSVKETVHNPYDLFAVVGKPGDTYTKEWLDFEGIPNVVHNENLGFPYSVNDIYDYAWKYNDYDNLILMGNDVVLYPYAGDSLIDFANVSLYSVISGLQYDVKDLFDNFPEVRRQFVGDDYIIEDFSQRPWDYFKDYSPELSIADMQLFDIQNLCLYKRKAFEKVGYTDVNFYPAYYIDNDYANRIVKSHLNCCTLTNARFFHFWSRTIKQGTGGSTPYYFENNRKYYKQKWGGLPGSETANPPIKIDSRVGELEAVRGWRRVIFI
jgi:GT2 family glycosyltransferase